MRAFKVMPKALRILAKKLTHLACNSRAHMCVRARRTVAVGTALIEPK